MELPRNQNGFSISFRFAQCVLVTFVNNNNNNSNGATEKSHFLVKLLTLHHRNRRRLENLLRQRHRCYTTWSLESWLFVIVILVSIANPPLPCFLTPPPFCHSFYLGSIRSIYRSIDWTSALNSAYNRLVEVGWLFHHFFNAIYIFLLFHHLEYIYICGAKGCIHSSFSSSSSPSINKNIRRTKYMYISVYYCVCVCVRYYDRDKSHRGECGIGLRISGSNR